MSGPRSRSVPALLLAAVAVVIAGAVAVSAQSTAPRIAVLARSDNPVDALAASAIAAQFGGAVYLTPTAALDPEARAGLVEFAPELVIIAGGPVAISPEVEAAVKAIPLPTRRVAGETRISTARALNQLLSEFDAVFPLASDVDAVVAALTSRVAALETGVHALVIPGDPVDVQRAAGVSGVTSPGAGVFCIAFTPAAGVDLTKDVVQVAVEWSNSIGDNLVAHWDAAEVDSPCPAGQAVVQTFSFELGEGVSPNDVAFTISVG